MRAVCFEEVGRVGLHSIADPVIEAPTDAIVRVRVAGLCGSDLHPFFGREEGLAPLTVMGHEFVGEVVEVGPEVGGFSVGDSVCAPFTTSCGRCFYCRAGLTSRCEHGQLFGWRQDGVGLHGGQAQYVRVPLADGTLVRIPEGLSDDVALLLGDNLSTGYFCAEMAGIRPQGVYAVIGCGTVGLLAVAAAFRLGAERVFAHDPQPDRLAMAAGLGAAVSAEEDGFVQAIHEATAGRGADAAMEGVGLPQAQRLAYRVVRPGATISVVGCHCSEHFAFGPADAYDKNLTYRTGRCPARNYMDRLAGELADRPMDLFWCVSHRFALEDGVSAWRVFAGREDGCIKAVLDVG
jgi:threonine dehydrogenase-like Zn-dependent dehydrogenase